MIIKNLYHTKIRCTNATNDVSDINSNMIIEVKLIDYNLNPVVGKTVSLDIDAPYDVVNETQPARQTITGTTDSNGTFTHTVTDAIHGPWNFTCNETSFSILRDGWKQIYDGTNVKVYHSHHLVRVAFTGTISGVGTSWKVLYTIPYPYLRPYYPTSDIVWWGSQWRVSVQDTGAVRIVTATGSNTNPGLSQEVVYQKRTV